MKNNRKVYPERSNSIKIDSDLNEKNLDKKFKSS